MAEVGFVYGAVTDSLENQAKNQGYTLGGKREILENMKYGLVLNYLHGTLTDSAYERALQKLHKQVIAALKPIIKEEL
jgi:hypothetical protein